VGQINHARMLVAGTSPSPHLLPTCKKPNAVRQGNVGLIHPAKKGTCLWEIMEKYGQLMMRKQDKP